MAITNININIDSELKEKAQYIFESLGLDMSTAINMLLHKTVYQKELPFKFSIEKPAIYEKKDRRSAFGCLKDKIHVPDDFNEPLEDFKEYSN